MSIEKLYTMLRSKLLYFIQLRVSDKMHAEDILHDVFIKIHANINLLKDTNKVEKWIFQITRNEIIDYYRKQKPASLIEDDILNSPEEEADLTNNKASLGLFAMIDELPELYKEALLITEVEGLTQKQFASKANITISGAKSRVQRAKKLLRDKLLECCHFEYDKYGTVVDYKKYCCCCSKEKL